MATCVDAATLTALRVPLRPTVVPRQSVYWIRVPATDDLADVLRRLTEHDVQVLEIRRKAERTAPVQAAERCADVLDRPPADPTGVVVPLRAGRRAPDP